MLTIHFLLHQRGGFNMIFFKWLEGIIILFCLIALIFKVGGNFINFLLLIATFTFIIDILFSKKEYRS